MPFKTLAGCFLRHYWFPFETHNTKPIDDALISMPSKGCKGKCEKEQDCCLWGLRAVESFKDAQGAISNAGEDKQDAAERERAFGWEVRGEGFASVSWCFHGSCTDDSSSVTKLHLGVAELDSESHKFKMFMKRDSEMAFDAHFTESSDSFHLLVTLTDQGLSIYRHGEIIGKIVHVGRHDLETLEEVASPQDGVTFVKSFECGLFKSIADAKKVDEESLHSDTMKECPVEMFSDDLHISNVGGSRGISFVSLVGAVCASVSIVLFASRRTRQLEVQPPGE